MEDSTRPALQAFRLRCNSLEDCILSLKTRFLLKDPVKCDVKRDEETRCVSSLDEVFILRSHFEKSWSTKGQEERQPSHLSPLTHESLADLEVAQRVQEEEGRDADVRLCGATKWMVE